jgi:hypothetical protein
MAVIWLIFIFATNPSGSFPLNDDWNYARTVKSLTEEHSFLITEWSLAASLTQTLIGYLICLLFGFSFEALRTATAIFGFLAAVCAYAICLKTGAPRAICVLLALVLCGNPLFFNLSLTFMTDVPFLALAGALLLIFWRLLATNTDKRTMLLTAASLLSAALCLLRQMGLILPVSFAIAYLLHLKANSATLDGARPQANVRKLCLSVASGLAPLFCSALAVTFFQLWLGREYGTLYSYKVEQFYLQQLFSKGPLFVLLTSAAHAISAFIYLGLFTLPAMPVVYPRLLSSIQDNRHRLFVVALAVELAFCLGLGLHFSGLVMPLADNVFYDFGLGPLLLPFAGSTSTNGWPRAPRGAMVAIGLIGAVGAGLLLSFIGELIFRSFKQAPIPGQEVIRRFISLCLIAVSLHLAIVCVRGFFDRYLLFTLFLLLPLLAAGAAQNVPVQLKAAIRTEWVTVLLLWAPLAFFSVAGTHDYFSWNRARWQALHKLTTEQGISAMDIDGGLEFNGWLSYEPRYRKTAVVFSPSMTHNNAYAISLAPATGFKIVERYRFQRWLPASLGEIMVLKKETGTR